MTPTEPLPLHHSWSLSELDQKLDMGRLLDGQEWHQPVDASPVPRNFGRWACDLADNALVWSPQVYRLFGLPEDRAVVRGATIALYAERSRAALERLRAYAIRHRRGVTLDVAIRPVGDRERWIRIVAAPVSEDGQVVRLRGCKMDVSALYR